MLSLAVLACVSTGVLENTGCQASTLADSYTCMVALPLFEVHWNNDTQDNETNMAIVGVTSGYVAVGFSLHKGRMQNSEAIIGFVDAYGKVQAHWYSLNGKSIDDVQPSEYNLKVHGGSYEDSTTIEFSIPHAGAPSTFVPNGANQLIWAIGSSSSIRKHHERGSFELDFSTGKAVSNALPFSVWKWYLFHGIYMLFAWGVVLPAGALVARFLKGRLKGGEPARWFVLHRGLQIVGISIATAGLILTVTRDEFGDVDTLHGVLGIVVMSGGFAQILNAILRPLKPLSGERVTTARFVWKIVHTYNGYAILLLSSITILLGIGHFQSITNDSHSRPGFVMYVAFAATYVYVICFAIGLNSYYKRV